MLNSKYKQKYLKYKQKYIQALTKQKGGETKKVLVLCQRKTGKTNITKLEVEVEVVPKITVLIQKLLGTDTTTIYMTRMNKDTPGTVDIDCNLDGITECSKEFIKEHRNSFDLIILQTCPIIFLNLNIITNLVKPGGMLGITSFPNKYIKNFFHDKIICELSSKNLIQDSRSTDDVLLFTKNI